MIWVGLWCFKIFIFHFYSNYLNQFACRHMLYVFYMLYFCTRLSHRIVAAIHLRFDVRILFNMKYMSSLGILFGQEMQSNHEMDFTNLLLTAYLTLKLTENYSKAFIQNRPSFFFDNFCVSWMLFPFQIFLFFSFLYKQLQFLCNWLWMIIYSRWCFPSIHNLVL